MKKNNTKFVSVIIPTLNREQILINSIKDVLKQDYRNFEIIVVDQSDTESKEVQFVINKNRKIIKYIHLTKKSLTNARNVGVKNSKGEIVLFLDDDIKIKSNKFIYYHALNYDDPKIGGIAGRILGNDVIIDDKIKEVGKFKYLGLKVISNFSAKFRTYVDTVQGCNHSFSKKAYYEAGGYCNLYKGSAHMEETDFSFRVKNKGYDLVFDPRAELIHLMYPVGGCRVENIYETRYWIVHNYTFFFLKYYNPFLFPVYFMKQFIWASLSGIKRADFKMFLKINKALVDGYKYYFDIEKKEKEEKT